MEDLKQSGFGENDVPITIDVEALYPSIPLEEGISLFGEKLEERKDKTVPTDFLLTLLRLVLMFNVVEFDKRIYHQVWGVSMGSKISPTFVDIFMAALEKKFMASLATRLREKIKFYKRYLDDILLIWDGSQTEFEEFFKLLNGFHRNLNFTCVPDFKNKTTTFLDVNVKIAGGCLTTDLYVKPTSANQYLSPLSIHPGHICTNIPYSLAFRIKRICSEESDFEKQLDKLKTTLLARDYKSKVIDSAFNRVRALSRDFTLKKVVKEDSDKLTFVITYDPRLPPIHSVLHKHVRTLMMDADMRETFPDGFQVAFKRHRNVKEFLCR